MRLKFNNIGIIKEADILIDGITVLAGVNDTGKSTVGKLLYTLVKVSNNYKNQLRNDQANRLFNLIDKFIEKANENQYQEYHLRKKERASSDRLSNLLLKERNELRKNEQETKVKIRKIIESNLGSKSDIINEIEAFINDNDIYVEGEIYKNYKNEIDKILNLDENSESVKRAAVDIMIDKEFESQITSSFYNNRSEIVLEENNTNITQLVFKRNEIEEISNLLSSSYNDITYIDIPFSFENEIINGHFPSRKGQYLINHKKDLQRKLYAKFINGDDDRDIIDEIERKKIIEKFEISIKQLIGGDFGFNKKERNFVFSKNGDEFKVNNTAEGIKAFGIIKILLESRFIKKDSILIIDEPEIHLHPQWQINYTELLVRLVKELGIKVIVNSHSTYMIEAFKIYSDHYGISDTTNFYLMKKKNRYSEAKLVNNQLNVIYEELSSPYSKLDNVLLNDFDK